MCSLQLVELSSWKALVQGKKKDRLFFRSDVLALGIALL